MRASLRSSRTASATRRDDRLQDASWLYAKRFQVQLSVNVYGCSCNVHARDARVRPAQDLARADVAARAPRIAPEPARQDRRRAEPASLARGRRALRLPRPGRDEPLEIAGRDEWLIRKE